MRRSASALRHAAAVHHSTFTAAIGQRSATMRPEGEAMADDSLDEQNDDILTRAAEAVGSTLGSATRAVAEGAGAATGAASTAAAAAKTAAASARETATRAGGAASTAAARAGAAA